MPIVEPMRMAIDAAISYHATVLIQIRVNIAIGDVKGINEHTFIKILSISPELIEKFKAVFSKTENIQ